MNGWSDKEGQTGWVQCRLIAEFKIDWLALMSIKSLMVCLLCDL